MPAATTDNLLVLPRIPRPDAAVAKFRPLVKIITAPTFLEGAGFQVRRPFPGADMELADPFLLLDHLGAALTLAHAPLLYVETEGLDGAVRTALAFNDAWVERSTGQTAWIEVRVNGESRLPLPAACPWSRPAALQYEHAYHICRS